MRVSPGAGTGWRYIKDGTWQYLLAGSGWCVVTATATHCAGVRIEDANYPVPRPTQAGDATASLVADLTSTRTVMVAVLDPTSDTEVIVTAIPIPPPYLVEVFRAWVGGCRGADTNQPAHRHRRRMVGNPNRADRDSDGRRLGRHTDSATLGRCFAGPRGAHRCAEQPVPLCRAGKLANGVRSADHDQPVRADHLRSLTPQGVGA